MKEGKWDICWSSRAQWKASPLQTALENRVPACSRPHYDCRIEPNGIQMHLTHRLCFQCFLVPLRLDRDPNRYFSTRLIWHFRSSLFIGPGVHTQIIAFWIGSFWECMCSNWGLLPSVGSLIVFLIGHHMAFQGIPKPKELRELGTRQWKCVTWYESICCWDNIFDSHRTDLSCLCRPIQGLWQTIFLYLFFVQKILYCVVSLWLFTSVKFLGN